MNFPQSLIDGYQTFRKEQYEPLAKRYATFAEGQNPDTLVIACADSRVDPTTIFTAGPGEIFVMRNVAALVPPYQPDGGLHGASAGLEFAVTALNVSNIVVMGHGLCGGVNACLSKTEGSSAGEFIDPWVELAAPARAAVNRELPDGNPEQRQRLGEYRTIQVSLDNIRTFPFVANRLEKGDLSLFGVWYSVYEGDLRLLDPDTGDFNLLDA
ncbi:carbonic anhydrase [Aquisalinus flavus]|uniref:Carbonic anhydrase n=1 Tax=Aquisalinus flavus TaxID=1526572 RepID=A0A8J2V382_9PROT|nr:carbonic anhydrase [Aquisalinus flavus]MBD0426228.1 carbonic anhydrase [Aquisalinus flavus]UNE48200.1 carbonic anhydrase [Aquisalinus flavus]GGD09582.1 carbonic anhydrase [Aquisalinus flavus]